MHRKLLVKVSTVAEFHLTRTHVKADELRASV